MKKFFLLNIALLASNSFAHAPLFDCYFDKNDQENIYCEGGFSDGSDAANIDVIALDYDDNVVFQGKLDQNSQIKFKKPTAEQYYIRFEGGDGHEIELDYLDIETR